jgi:cytochrome c
MEPEDEENQYASIRQVTAIAVMFMFSLSAHAQNAAEALYKSKCAGCHGAEGTGSATVKKSVGQLPVGRQCPLRISRSRADQGKL